MANLVDYYPAVDKFTEWMKSKNIVLSQEQNIALQTFATWLYSAEQSFAADEF